MLQIEIDDLDRRSDVFNPIFHVSPSAWEVSEGYVCVEDSVELKDILIELGHWPPTLLHSTGRQGSPRLCGLAPRNKMGNSLHYLLSTTWVSASLIPALSGQARPIQWKSEMWAQEEATERGCVRTNAQVRAALGSQAQPSGELSTALLTYPGRWESARVKKQERMKWRSQVFSFFLSPPKENHLKSHKWYRPLSQAYSSFTSNAPCPKKYDPRLSLNTVDPW